MIRLGVNVDHIATLRNARDESYPVPAQAAALAERAGASNITCHLREDRRHIRDEDVSLIKETVSIPLNFEIAITDEMISFAKSIKPHTVTLVPEKREERTTEGGLAFGDNNARIRDAIAALRDSDITVALFVEATEEAMDISAELGAHAVELHTGHLCIELDRSNLTRKSHEVLKPFQVAALRGFTNGLQIHVGHGLNYSNAQWIQLIPHCEEANIGHAIVARAALSGMQEATEQMLRLINDPIHKPIANPSL